MKLYALRYVGLLLLIFLSACQMQPDMALKSDWQHYKMLFLSDDGRIVDTGNQGVSHSEGQGYGLILAVYNQDQEAFQRIWQWTKTHLQVRNDKLFMWRKQVGVPLAQEDPNNATDGDILIAWALLKAANTWQVPDYRKEAAGILLDVKQKLIVTGSGMPVLLPGEYGFQSPDATVLNLSYWVFPALKAFSIADEDPVWQQLIDSGRLLLKQARYGRWQLPPDWLQLNKDGSIQATKVPRFGYDAIRIPLYLLMEKIHDDQLMVIADYWVFYQAYTPAWIAVNENVMDSFGADKGISAVKALTLWFLGRTKHFEVSALDDQQNYYSATLLLLSKLAYLQNQ